ncbi:MAG: extracellular solute-binding protein, partial [Acidilobaceae archaeon]
MRAASTDSSVFKRILLFIVLALVLSGALLPFVVLYILQNKTRPTTPPSTERDMLRIGDIQIRVPPQLKAFAERAKRGEINVTVNILVVLRGLESVPLVDQISRFMQEYPGINVNYGGKGTDVREIMYEDFVIGEGKKAHVLVWSHNWTGELAEGGFLVSLSKVLPTEVLEQLKSQYAPYASSAGVYRQELYGLPLNVESSVLLCNSDLTGGVLPQRFSQLEEIMSRHYKPEGKTYGLAWQINSYHVYPVVTAFGGFYYDEEKDTVGLNSPGTVEGFSFLLSRVFPYMLIRIGVLGEWTQIYEIFEKGRAPCLVTGSWNIYSIKYKVKNLLVGPIPEIEGKVPRPLSGVQLMGLTTAAEDDLLTLYASILLIICLTLKEETLRALASEAVYVPAKLSTIDFVRKNADRYPLAAGVMKSVDNSVLMSSSSKMAKVWGPIEG